MKIYTIHHPSTFLADFIHAFMPVAKISSKPTQLIQQARRAITNYWQPQQPINQPTKSEVDRDLLPEFTADVDSSNINSSSSRNSSNTDDSSSCDSSDIDDDSSSYGLPELSASEAKELEKLMTSDPDDEFDGPGYCEEGAEGQMPLNLNDPSMQYEYYNNRDFRRHYDNKFTVQAYHYDDPAQQLRTLTQQAIFVHKDCHRPLHGGGHQQIRDGGMFSYGTLKPREENYSCSDSSDDYNRYFKPTFNTLQFVHITATEARLLKTAALTSPDPAYRAFAIREYDTLTEWLDTIPTTDKPDRISYSGESAEGSTESNDFHDESSGDCRGDHYDPKV